MAAIGMNYLRILSKFCLEDKVALITGAGSGIGQGIALGFSGVGAKIIVADLKAGRSEDTSEKVRSQGGKSLSITVDTTDAAQVARMVKTALSEFGKIDILVNNVGGGGPHSMMAPLWEMSEETWDSAIKANLKSTFLCSKAVGRVMRDQKRGNIINIASVTGKQAHPLMMQYAAAKAGVINLTLSMAVHLAPYRIRVNGIAPGIIATPATAILGDLKKRARRLGIPLQRPGLPEDVAYSAIFLASDAADYITGVIIDVSGGPYLGTHLLKLAEEGWKSRKT